jgi:DNA/RNA-binding domain of Phe-tRNA-synthetase-like protein
VFASSIWSAFPPRADVIVSDAWSSAYESACVGVLRLAGVRNPDSDPALEALLDETSAQLRNRWTGASRTDLLAVPELAAYAAYYRRFDKTYHVLLQLESVALKGKPLRARGALVAAMFRAELESGLLTAGHDARRLAGELTLDVVTAADRYAGIGGRDIDGAPGDMCIRDGIGIISSIVYGPDDRTRIRESTSEALFTTYAPPEIGRDRVARHLEALAAGVRVVAPDAVVESIEVFPQRS